MTTIITITTGEIRSVHKKNEKITIFHHNTYFYLMQYFFDKYLNNNLNLE